MPAFFAQIEAVNESEVLEFISHNTDEYRHLYLCDGDQSLIAVNEPSSGSSWRMILAETLFGNTHTTMWVQAQLEAVIKCMFADECEGSDYKAARLALTGVPEHLWPIG